MAKESKASESSLFERLAPVILVVIIGLAFAVGVLWQKVENLEDGTSARVANTNTGTNNQPSQPSAPTSGKLDSARADKVAKVSEDDFVFGSRDAKVFLIEYSDLQCPYCKNFHPTAEQAVDEYAGEVAWVYRHFPLDSIHPQARPAAIASECVGQIAGNDAFWTYTKNVFENQAFLNDLEGAAEDMGIAGTTFTNCLAAAESEDKVEADYQSGIAAGVNGTPGNFVINDKGEVWSLPGAVPISTLKQTIDEALGS